MKKQEDGIELNRTQFMILRRKQPGIYSIADIEVEGRGPTLKAFIRPIKKKDSCCLNTILKNLFPKMDIPTTS